METALSVAVRIYDLFRPVHLGHGGERTFVLQDARRRIMQKQDIPAVPGCSRRLKGNAQSFKLPVHQLFRVLRFLLVPSDDLSPAVEVKRAFKAEALCPDKRIVLVWIEVILQEQQLSGIALIKHLRLFRVPEHIMIAAQKDFAPGQLCDKLQVLHTFLEIAAPAVVPDKNEGVLGLDHFRAVLLYLLFMVFPCPVFELGFRFQIRLKMEMQISDRVQAHVSLLHISGINIAQLFPCDFCEPQNTFSLRRRSVRHPVTREKACDMQRDLFPARQ